VRTGVIPGAPDTWIPPSGRSSSFFAGLVGPAAAGGPAGGGAGAGGAGVRAELAAAGSPRERLAVLEDHVAGHVRAVLRLGDRTLDRETPLRALGFDSLLSIELRTRLQNGLGITLASNFVWQHETLAALSTGLATQLDLD
jgi:phthioceranic/hydroxyphthioceranic acid synthase